jgi:hypothetical protein
VHDAGDKFVDKGDPRDLAAPWAEGPRDLSLDRQRGELHVKVNQQKWFRIEEKTGKILDPFDLTKVHAYNLNAHDKGTQIVVAPDGNIVSYN